jgi:Ser/Thr protein kinase RdoA (MazF antagonist)
MFPWHGNGNRTVDTLLSISAKLFDIPEISLHPVRGGHVSRVFAFTRDGQEYILRLTPPGEDLDLSVQKASLAWMAFLAHEGVGVSRPVPSINNELIETIPQEQGDWLAVVQTKAAGVLSEEWPLEKWDAGLFEALGREVGRMHAAARRYVPAAGLSRPGWEQCSNLFNWNTFTEPWLEKKSAEVREKISVLPRTAENYGMIHADLHFGNFIVDVPSKAVAIIDFDDICAGWYIMDLAILLFDILVLYEGPSRETFAIEFLLPLLEGYCRENSLDPYIWAQVPLFTKLLEINLYAEISPSYAPGSGWWGDKFMPGRREHIENNIPYIAIDFSKLIPG